MKGKSPAGAANFARGKMIGSCTMIRRNLIAMPAVNPSIDGDVIALLGQIEALEQKIRDTTTHVDFMEDKYA